MCNGRTEYCEIQEGGVIFADGGTNKSYSCVAIPANCAGDHTCACIDPSAAPDQQCSESDGDVTVTEESPVVGTP